MTNTTPTQSAAVEERRYWIWHRLADHIHTSRDTHCAVFSLTLPAWGKFSHYEMEKCAALVNLVYAIALSGDEWPLKDVVLRRFPNEES